MRYEKKSSVHSLIFCLLLCLAGCHLAPSPTPVSAPPDLARLGVDTRQAVLVSAAPRQFRCAVTICLFERRAHAWRQVGTPIEGVAGRNGLAPAGAKREGDGRTPSGVFPLERAFGYAPLATRLPYTVLTPDDVWIDDPASPRYNMLSTRAQAAGFSHEIMRRRDDLYRYGLVIEYNTKPVVPGAGSAIFFHVWSGPASSTAGCVAAPAAHLVRLLRWLDPSQKPVIVINNSEYHRLRRRWLP